MFMRKILKTDEVPTSISDHFHISVNDQYNLRSNFTMLKLAKPRTNATLDTSCPENVMVLSARRGFLHATFVMGKHMLRYWASRSISIGLTGEGYL
jgi:hypothetical protein